MTFLADIALVWLALSLPSFVVVWAAFLINRNQPPK